MHSDEMWHFNLLFDFFFFFLLQDFFLNSSIKQDVMMLKCFSAVGNVVVDSKIIANNNK